MLKIAIEAARHQALADLGVPSLLRRVESTFHAPPVAHTDAETDARAQRVLAAERAHLASTYGLDPTLFGSMSTGLNVPGDVDIDLFNYVPDRSTFDAAVKNLTSSGRYRSSALNVPGAALQVFKRDAADAGDFPVDVVLGHGPNAQAFHRQIGERAQAAHALPDDVKNGLIEQKRYFRHTWVDPGKHRYTAFKQKVDNALTNGHAPVMLDRTAKVAALAKLARILNMENRDDAEYLHSFLADPTLHGHRTTNAEGVLSSGRIMSGLQALSEGRLKDYEHGYLPGLRSQFHVPELADNQLQHLERATLQATPDADALSGLGAATGASQAELRGALIRHRLPQVNAFLRTMDPQAAEDWRMQHLRIPKLSPHVFMTQGGLIDDQGYGDTGFLVHTPKAERSPYMTLVNQEAIVAPHHGLEMRSVDARKGLVTAAPERLQELEKRHPEYTYVSEQALPRERRLNAISTQEIGRRILPNAVQGKLKLTQG